MTGRKTYLQPSEMVLNAIHDIGALQKGQLIMCDTPRGANKVKPIFWLSVWEGFFRISFFFSTSVQTELKDLPISQEMKELIDNVKPMGKSMRYIPLVIDIKTKPQLGDVYTIAIFRKTK